MALLDAVSGSRCVFVDGPNFSGRSEVLQHIARLPIRSVSSGRDSYGNELPPHGPRGNIERYAYVGPEVYQSLSGLAGTVKAELALNAFGGLADIDSLSAQVGLAEVAGQGCFELSGGQQAILAVTSSAILRPRVLSLDCCLEQVDGSRRDVLLRSILDLDKETTVVIADNEMGDLPVPDGTLRLTHEHPDSGDHFFQMSAAKCKHSFPPRMDAPRLRLKGIDFAYRSSSPVLRGLNMELEPGRVYWLRGANGSGKSTIAKLLAGVLAPQKGEIVADGEQIRPTESPGALVSYHFQNPDFQLFSTTVWDEVLAGPRALGCPEVEATDRSRLALMQMAIPDNLHGEHPLDLPFTLRKRVAVAAAISSGAPWLVMDEPSLGQDAQNTSAMAALIRGIADAGTGVILISHSSRLTADVAETTLRLESGDIQLGQVMRDDS
jgi:ABC-type cobalt transport system, ATPase component